MSYSFSVRGADRAACMLAVREQFDNIVASQPVHARDRAAAEGAVDAMLGVLAEDAAKDVYVSVYGSVGWRDEEAEQKVTSAQVSVTAGYAERIDSPANS